MRIAFLSRIVVEHGVAGGMEQHGRALCEGLAGRGHDVVTITTAHPAGLRDAAGPAGRTIFVPAPPRRYSAAWRRLSWEALAREHARAPFDCILSQSAGAQSAAVPARQALGLPTVVILHGTIGGDWQTMRRSIGTPRGALRAARYLSGVPGQILRWRPALRAVARWVAVSTAVRDAWTREMGVPPASVAVVHNGVDVARFRPDEAAREEVRRRLGLGAGEPVLLAVGRLDPTKGLQVAVGALARLGPRSPAARLLIAGEGGYRAELERRAAQLGDRVRLLGYVPNQELPALLAAADLFLMPTLCHEGFPLTVVEALACGLPALASRSGGIPDAVEDGVTGRLLPMGDAAAWAGAIAELLDDRRRRLAIGAVCRQVAEARFSRERMVASMERVIGEAAQEAAGWRS